MHRFNLKKKYKQTPEYQKKPKKTQTIKDT